MFWLKHTNISNFEQFLIRSGIFLVNLEGERLRGTLFFTLREGNILGCEFLREKSALSLDLPINLYLFCAKSTDLTKYPVNNLKIIHSSSNGLKIY